MTAAWSGRRVTEARAIVVTWLPAPCGQCGKPVTTTDRWVIGHKIARSLRPDLTWEPSNWRPEHRACSDRTGQAAVIAKAKRDALRDAGITDFPHDNDLGQPPPLPVSLPAEPLAIAEGLSWAAHVRDAPSWLSPYLDVPDNATPPTAMTPVHPEAAGSYGPALLAWAAKEMRVKPRWWQALVIVRILEHREDGSLCWPEVLMSCSRRSGKSVVVRLLALWRLVLAPGLFEEQQLIVHSASTLKIAKEPMRYATRWIEQQSHLKVVRNNNSPGVEDTEGDHRWLVVPSDKTAGLDTCMGVLDEAWAIKPEVVDDDLEPSLLERVSPQLLLISTAHRRATSLMRNRISQALAMEDSERVLLLLWCALPDDPIGDPATWRKASAHWSDDRAAYIARKYAKAVAGEVDPEADDPNPIAGFEAQYLNRWPLKTPARAGDPVVDSDAWAALTEPAPVDAPDAAAVESWFAEGVSVALGWRQGSRVVVSVTDHADLSEAVAAVKEAGYRGVVTVGSSLKDDPALKGVRVKAGEGRVAAAVAELARLLTEDALRHDGEQHLTDQVLNVRTMPGADGARVVSRGRADAVKAALWVAAKCRAAGPGAMRIVLPKSARQRAN